MMQHEPEPRLMLSNVIQDIPLNRQVLYPRLLALSVLTAIDAVAALVAPFFSYTLRMSLWNIIISSALFYATYIFWKLSTQWAPPSAASFGLLWAGHKKATTVAADEAKSISRAAPDDFTDKTLQRVAKIFSIEPPIHGESGWIYPNNAYEIIDVKREDPKDPTSTVKAFTILATTAGAFTQKKNQDYIIDSIRAGVEKGKLLWDNRVDSSNDRITFYRKKEFPAVIFPDLPERIAQTPAEATAMFKENSFLPFGEDPYGNVIGIRVEKLPHGIVIGSSGSGKTVYIAQGIEYLRARGVMIMLFDGKFASFAKYQRIPNIVYTAMDTYDLVWGMAWARRQMQARYAKMKNIGKEASRSDTPGQESSNTPQWMEPPLFIILDELDTAKSSVKDTFGKKALDSFMESIADILRLGRQARVYLLLGNQSYYADTLGGQLKANVHYKVTLGEVTERTLQEAFSEENKNVARRLSESIPKEAKGRGIQEVTETDDNGNETGNRIISEFLTYFGFNHAAEEMPTREPAKTEWEKYKTQVSDKVPQLYPHFTYKRPYPDEASDIPEGARKITDWKETIKDHDYDILASLDICEPIALDFKKEDGTWEYYTDPEITKYDPINPDYVGDTGDDLSGELIQY